MYESNSTEVKEFIESDIYNSDNVIIQGSPDRHAMMADDSYGSYTSGNSIFQVNASGSDSEPGDMPELEPGSDSDSSIDSNDDMPLHLAADNGHFKICKMFMRMLEDKNPKGYYGFTVLHNAASNGHRKICQMIMENIEGVSNLLCT